MKNKITCRNGFRAIKSLEKAAADPRIEEIEGEGMDDGRVFIVLKTGYVFKNSPWQSDWTRCHSVGNAAEIRDAMSIIVEGELDAGLAK